MPNMSLSLVKLGVLFLIILNANMLAKISWSMVSFINKTAFSLEQIKVDKNKRNIEYEARAHSLISINKTLFGAIKSDLHKKEPSAIEQSRLNVTVTGIVYSDVPANNILIIERNGKQNSYAIGDTIDGTAAVIREVEPQRVIVERAGNFESLTIEPTERANTNANTVNDIKTAVAKKSDNLLDYISIAPVNEAGHLQGYRINPGKNPDVFNKSGLNPNDLAVAVNGYDLRDNAQSAQFMATISEQMQFTISVLREGAEKEIVIDLNSL